jgi:hypothetical protein
VQILGDAPAHPSISSMAQPRDRGGGESLDVLEDEKGEDGDEDDHPGGGEPREKRGRGLLSVGDDLTHVRLHEAPEHLSALDALGHLGELLRQGLDLDRQRWPDREHGAAERRDHYQVYGSDRQRSARDQPALREPDEWKQKVGEEQRKRDEQQHSSDGVGKADGDEDDQNGPGDARRPWIE